MAKHSSQILDLARRGAELRFQELKSEISALVKNFPHLSGRKGAQAGEPSGTRRRRKMSAKARAAISAAQKARWAKQRAGAKKA